MCVCVCGWGGVRAATAGDNDDLTPLAASLPMMALLLGYQVSAIVFKAGMLTALAFGAKGLSVARTGLTTVEYACLLALTVVVALADVYSDGAENTAILACYAAYAVYVDYLFRNGMHVLRVLASYIEELHQQALRDAESSGGLVAGGGDGGHINRPGDLSAIEKLSLAYRRKHQAGR